jgi:hypothetical protein
MINWGKYDPGLSKPLKPRDWIIIGCVTALFFGALLNHWLS